MSVTARQHAPTRTPPPARGTPRASSSAASGVFMNAPEPAFTSRTIRSVRDGELLRHHARRDQRDRLRPSRWRRAARTARRRPARGSPTARRRRSRPARPARASSSARGRCAGPGSTRACRACRPCARGRARRASRPRGRAPPPSGANTSVTPSATPPVECLSTLGAASPDRSTVSPESTIARVIARVSSASRPRRSGHQERGGERVADLAPRVALDEGPNLSGSQRPAVALGGDDRAGIGRPSPRPSGKAAVAMAPGWGAGRGSWTAAGVVSSRQPSTSTGRRRRTRVTTAPAPARREALPEETLDLDPEEIGDGGAEVPERPAGPDLGRAARAARRPAAGCAPASGRSAPSSGRSRGRR